MANLSGIGFDPDVPENTGEFVVLPPGRYQVTIIRDQLRENKAKTGMVLELDLQVIAGPHVGTTIKDYINIQHSDSTAQRIGQGTLKRICNICGVEYPPEDTVILYGKPMIVNIDIEEFTSNRTGKTLQSNKVRSYSRLESGTSTTAGQGAQAPPPSYPAGQERVRTDSDAGGTQQANQYDDVPW